jgi:hypothetical protein
VKRRDSRFALTAIVLALPFAVWAALPLGEDQPYLDRNVEPVDLPPEAKTAMALVAWVVVLAAAGALLSPAGRAVTRRQEVRVAIPLVISGAYMAVTYNVMTQPVSGANIGAGLMFFAGCVLVPAMLALSAWRLWQLHRARPSHPWDEEPQLG